MIRQENKDKYEVVQMIATLGHANTLAIDFKTHQIYTSTSLYKTEPSAAAKEGETPAKPAEAVIPGTASVLVYAP